MPSRKSSAPADPAHEVDAELAFHVEMQTRRFIAAGLDPAAARARALQRLGDLDRARVECRAVMAEDPHMTHTRWHHGLLQDLAYAARVLRRSPAFAATTLLTIALAVGANTAIFSVVHAVLVRGVPYPEAGGLVMVWNSYAQTGLERAAIAPAEFDDFLATGRAFEDLAAIRHQPTALSGDCAGCDPERVMSYVVSPRVFDVLRTRPRLGRAFVDADGVTGAERVVLLGDALWRRRFGADPSIVGRTINVGALARTVIGVMPPGVRFPDAPVGFLKAPADLWIPYGWEQARDQSRGNQSLGVIARLRAGVTSDGAQADLDRIAADFTRRFPDRYARGSSGWRLVAVPLVDQMVGDVRRGLLVIFGVVGLVLLIACANVANLLLARGQGRERELAVRTALGASRARLARLVLAETMVLVCAGGALGLGIAALGIRGVLALDPGDIPLLATARLDWAVLGFSAIATVVTGMLIGLAPAVRQAHVDPQPALADGGARGSVSPGRHRARRGLVAAEVALAVIALVAAGLLIRSFARMQNVDTGIDATDTVIAQVALPRAQYDTAAKMYAFHQDFTARLRQLPGATVAAGVYPLPMSGEGWSGTLFVEGLTPSPSDPEPHAEFAVATPDYFGALGIRLLEGRDFGAADRTGAAPVAIVDDVLARKYWPGESAIGKRLNPWQAPAGNLWTTVIGVVEHVRNKGYLSEGEPQVYLPALQKAEAQLYYIVRAPGGVSPALVRAALADVDALLPPSRLAVGSDLVGATVARERFNLLLITLFGALALALASVGLYGAIAVRAGERSREIGIRLALGGTPGRVVRSIVCEGLAITSAGLAAGLIAAIALSQTMAGLLFEIEPTDPSTYAVIALVLLVTASLASLLPARRASRIDPLAVMKR